jgi:Holliday junction resolvase
MSGSGRPKVSQSKHNQEVLKEARELQREKYKVYADIKGYKKPPRRERFIPDIIAKKGKEEIIIEVETTDSANSPRDLAQQEAFKKAAKKSGAKFKRKIV